MAGLTDTAIRNKRPNITAYRVSDGGGLFVEVRPTSAKIWLYRFRWNSKQQIFTIGRYYDHARTINGKPVPPDHIGLGAARIERDKARALVKAGQHPTREREVNALVRRVEGSNTFEAITQEWIDANKSHWVESYRRKIERTLAADAFPDLGKLPIRSITAAHFLAIMKRLEKRGAKTIALLLRMWCSGIFRFAVSTLRADADPTAPLKGAVKRDKVKHKTPLTRDDIPAFIKKVNKDPSRITGIALQLLLLTFVRPGELRAAEWSEFDFDKAEWRIPEGRMKGKRLHIVPLARQAVELLRELHQVTGSGKYLFPNRLNADKCMANSRLNVALQRLGYKDRFTSHGFRTTASTQLNELGYNKDWIERQLAHVERDETRGAYNAAEYLPSRKQMMQDWANLIDEMAKAESNVTPIKRALA